MKENYIRGNESNSSLTASCHLSSPLLLIHMFSQHHLHGLHTYPWPRLFIYVLYNGHLFLVHIFWLIWGTQLSSDVLNRKHVALLVISNVFVWSILAPKRQQIAEKVELKDTCPGKASTYINTRFLILLLTKPLHMVAYYLCTVGVERMSNNHRESPALPYRCPTKAIRKTIKTLKSIWWASQFQKYTLKTHNDIPH